MSYEEEFDKIIRHKTEGAEFPFDEKNWERMRTRLDAEKQAGFRISRKFYYVVAVLLMCTITGVLVFKNQKSSTNTELSATSLKDLSATVFESLQNASPTSHNNEEGDAATIEFQNKNAVSISNEKIVMQQMEGNQGTASIEAMRRKNHLQENVPSTNENSANGLSQTSIRKQGHAEITSKQTNSETSLGNSNNKEPLVSNAGVSLSESMATDDEAYQLQTINSALPSDTLTNNLRQKHLRYFKFYDEEYYRRKNKTHYLQLEAGANYLLGWQINNGADGKGLGWFAGINYGIYLNRKLSISAGAQYYNVSNINTAFYTHTYTEYGFQATSTNTVITANTLYYASIPLKLTFAIDKYNYLGFGLNTGFLISAKNNVQTFDYSELRKSNVVDTKIIGIYEGTSSTNLSLSIFYKTQIAKRLALNGEFNYGLTDIFANTKTIANAEKTTGLRLSLQYTLFDK